MKNSSTPLNPLPRRVPHKFTKNLGFKDDKWARGSGKHGMARSYGHNVGGDPSNRTRREKLINAERDHTTEALLVSKAKNIVEKLINETGEPDQDYDHEFYDAIVAQLAEAGFPGARHREFDKYQGVYINIPNAGKFWTVDSYSTGKRVGEPNAQTFSYEPGTAIEHVLFQKEGIDSDPCDVVKLPDGQVDASGLIDCIKGSGEDGEDEPHMRNADNLGDSPDF